MGRDQVKRNQAARGRGRGSGAGGRGGAGGENSNNRRSATGKSSSSALGDNSHRYDHHSTRSSIDDEYDDDGRMEEFDTAFAHFDAASLSMGGGEAALDNFFDSSGPAARNSSQDNSNEETKARNSWMEIDIKAMDTYLRQNIPLHVRLQVPIHIASHIDERYGSGNSRKKTLAELREESKCTVNVNDDDGDGNKLDVNVDNKANEKDDADNIEDEENDDDDDDEDLEAWLDNVMS
jgi:hypothetical protein